MTATKNVNASDSLSGTDEVNGKVKLLPFKPQVLKNTNINMFVHINSMSQIQPTK